MNNSADRAREILDEAEATVDQLKDLVRELKAELEFGLARKLLNKALPKDPDDSYLKQQLALCTYKDEELLPAVRFARALEILEGIGLRDPDNTNAETLALGGAVCKRMWQYDGQLEHLYEALFFYRAAYERNPEADKGYGGINAAYILQLLASRAQAAAKRTVGDSAEAREFARQARELREQMATEVAKLAEGEPQLNDQYWFAVTMAEIHFGLENYVEAGEWISHASSLEAKEWEKETTFRQLVSIARLQDCELPKEGSQRATWHPAWQVLANMLGDDTERALSCYRGKTGLALSGGGFRASLFHLGVLARLAEMDVLRSVEVLSTVSGGSIVGAHFYLEVRNLLQTKSDKEITRREYIEIVKRVQQDFLAGVQRNLRTRAVASFTKNLKMIFSDSYTRSHRIGELYEKELYAQISDGHPNGKPRYMNDLLISPSGESDKEKFKPKFCNWRRRAKVPILLLNTTSLNSGHNWHFTATWMGEPPGLVGSEVDKNERYRRLYYQQAPTEDLKKFRLGYAVAASACVPGLFEPLVIEGLYPDRVVRLVDGGVHDNQGVQGLFDEGCTLILCSDASGQMADNKDPSDGLLAVPLRSNAILMDRVREAEYQDLKGRVDSRSLDGLFFIHLKKNLSVSPVDWLKCQDPTSKEEVQEAETIYGIATDLQERLAATRTDLDSFTEAEAYALMLSGYLMTTQEFRQLQQEHEKSGEPGQTWGEFDVDADPEDWPFLELKSIMGQPNESDDPRRLDLSRQLKVASSRLFKVWKLIPGLRWTAWLGAGVTALLTLWIIKRYWYTAFIGSPITVGNVILFIVVALGGIAVPWLRWLSPEKASRGILGKAVLAFFGYLASQLHLLVFDKLFLRRGKLERLFKLKGK